MSQSKTPGGDAAPSSVDAVFDALASRRRREMLSVLADREGPISETALVSHLVSRVVTNDGNASSHDATATQRERERTRTSLHHAHLPRLADAGLVARDIDRREVCATDHPVLETPTFDALLDSEIPDAVLSALADRRRRTMLTALRNAGRPLTELELAERVAAAEDAQTHTSEDPRTDPADDDRIARVLADFRHAHLPKLADAEVVEYDADTRTVAYEGHPELEAEWFVKPFGSRRRGNESENPAVGLSL